MLNTALAVSRLMRIPLRSDTMQVQPGLAALTRGTGGQGSCCNAVWPSCLETPLVSGLAEAVGFPFPSG